MSRVGFPQSGRKKLEDEFRNVCISHAHIAIYAFTWQCILHVLDKGLLYIDNFCKCSVSQVELHASQVCAHQNSIRVFQVKTIPLVMNIKFWYRYIYIHLKPHS